MLPGSPTRAAFAFARVGVVVRLLARMRQQVLLHFRNYRIHERDMYQGLACPEGL